MSISSRRRPARPPQSQPTEAKSPPSWFVQSAVVFAVALLLRGLHFWAMRDSLIYQALIGDSWQYDRWGQRIASGEWIGAEVFYQTPLYPYFLGVLYAVFGHSVWVVRIAQALLGSLACALLARTGSRYFDERTGWAAGLLLAVYPPAIFFDGILQKAALDLVLMCALLWVMSRARPGGTWGNVVALGAVLGGLILNRENAWVLFPVVVAWLLWLNWPQSTAQRALRCAILVAGMALVLLPVGLRNYYVGGEFLLTTSQMGPNFYIGNNRAANGQYVSLRPDRGDPRFESIDARVLAEEDTGRALSPSEVSQYWMDRSRRDIGEDPGRWMRLLAWKWFLTWNQVEVIDGEGIRVHQWHSWPLYALGAILNFGVLCTLGVAGVWFTRSQWRELWVLYALTLAFALAVTLFYVFARYRYPLVPMVTLFAGAGLVGAWQAIRSRDRAQRRELWIAGAIALPVAAATCWPLPALHSDEVTYFNVATALNDSGRSDDAVSMFEETLRVRPDFAPVYNNLATVALGQRDWDTAEKHLRKALQLDPNSANALVNLGKVQMERRDYASAEASFRKALEVEPYLIMAYQGLGQVEVRRGNAKRAVEYMRQAIAMDRQSGEAYADLAQALTADGQIAAAATAYSDAIERNPLLVFAANNLAWILATGPDGIRDGARAVALARELCKTTESKVAEFLDTLAAAHAEAGDYRQAEQVANQAAELAQAEGRTELAEQLRERAQGYQAGRPYRDPELQQPAQ